MLAKIVKGGETISIGTPVAVVAKNKEDAKQFTDYVFGAPQDKASSQTESVSTSSTKK